MKVTPAVAAPATKMPFQTSDNTAARIARAVEANNASLPVQRQTAQVPAQESKLAPPESAETKQTPGSEETKAAESEVTKRPEIALSQQHAVLARREKAIRANTQRLNAEREAFKAERATMEARLASLEQDIASKYVPKDRLTSDPFSVLTESGVSYEQLTNQILNQPSAEEQRYKKLEFEAAERFKKLEAEQETMKKSFEQKEQQDYEAAVSQLRNEARRLVQNDPAFETIKETSSVGEVVRLITETFEKDGELMSVDEAAQLVEEELINRILKTTNINKIKQKLQPAQQAPKAAELAKAAPAAAVQQPGQMRTLTNSSGSTRPLTRLERAIMAGRGEL